MFIYFKNTKNNSRSVKPLLAAVWLDKVQPYRGWDKAVNKKAQTTAFPPSGYQGMSLCMNGTNGPMWRGTACITSSSFQHIVKSAIWKNSSRKRKSISRIVQSVWHKVGERACNVRSYPYELEYLPRYGVAQVIGCLKGKSAILIHKRCLGREKILPGITLGCEVTVWTR